ncbi:F-box associated domain, type 1 [Artemisia annua]|uniref:F-box associated domain, type 1 n=1 Tax=Artemisia annua TaxID=35608 RepID=A0A2U1PWS9_ARTAN|nr:F-box associated domain, type 1 [Artemisia annua]
MEALDDYFLLDMLSRLDVKAIIYCKCVCKRWRDLVLDPHFVCNLHLPRSLSSPPSLIIHGLPRENFIGVNTYGGRGSRGEVSVGRPGYLKWVEMQQQLDGCQLTHVASHNLSDNRCSFPMIKMVTVGSVNGLVCVLQRSDAFFIFNPVFEEYMALPKPQLVAKRYELIRYGFGFSLASGEYKVIRICRKKNSMRSYALGTAKFNHVEIEVYTLGTDQWRTLGQVPYPDVYDYELGSSISLRGHVHWIIYGKIYAFDLDTETFMSFPSPPATGDCNKILGVLKGRLSQFSWSKYRFTVFEMREYGIKDSWYQEVHWTEEISHKLESGWKTWKPLCLIDGINGTTSNLIAVHENEDNFLKFGADRVHPFKKVEDLLQEVRLVALKGGFLEELPTEEPPTGNCGTRGFDGILFVSSMMIHDDLEAFLLKVACKSGFVLILELGSTP